MRFPRMTTRRLMLATLVLAAWLALIARVDRLRRISMEHMVQSGRAMAEAARSRPDGQIRPTPLSAWHLKQARAYHEEADFAAAFCVTLPIVAVLVGLGLPFLARLKPRPWSGRPAPAAEPPNAGDAGRG